MRFKFDREYVAGAVVLVVLVTLLVGAVFWAGSAELAYWPDPHHAPDMYGWHARLLLRVVGAVLLIVAWAIARAKRRKGDE